MSKKEMNISSTHLAPMKLEERVEEEKQEIGQAYKQKRRERKSRSLG